MEEKIFYIPEKEVESNLFSIHFSKHFVPISYLTYAFGDVAEFSYKCDSIEDAMKIIKLYKEDKLNSTHNEIVYSEVNDKKE